MEIELILGADMVGRIYEKFGCIGHPIATINFEEIPTPIVEGIEENLELEKINIEDYM